MATLNKILVHVPSSLCDGFKTKYVTATTNRDTSYDSKIVFLEKTQEIFTKGKLYGTNIGDFNALKELVGTLPSDATSTNIVDYITENINSVKTAVIGTSGDDKTAKTIYGAKAYASDMASTAAASVEAKLPVVANGSGITVTPSTDENGKTTYTVSTSAEVFHYKGNKTALSELPSTGNTTGDVWSVGPANAVGSTLYAWDGDEWINIGGANGITGVDTTSSKGVVLAKNANGTVKVNVTPGLIASGNGSVVTGGTVYTAIAEAEGRCDAKGTAQGLIDKLGGSATSTNGTYFSVTVNTSKGQVSEVTTYETGLFITAMQNAREALTYTNVLGKRLTKFNNSLSVDEAKTALGLGSAAFVDTSYFMVVGDAGSGSSADIESIRRRIGYVEGDVSSIRQNYVAELDTYNGVTTCPYIKLRKDNYGDGKYASIYLDETKVFNYVSDNMWENYTA